MKLNKKLLISLLAVGMLFSIALPNAINANEEGITTYALTDPAFPDSSRPLEEAIIAKYNGTGGTIKVDTDDNGRISQGEASSWAGLEIDLRGMGLTGTITGIEYFTNNLQLLYLDNNSFIGEIPTGIVNMISLQQLYLGNNNLTGSIPSNIGNLINLDYLYLYSNQLTGNIPTSLGNIPHIKRIVLSFNELSGEIPSSLGNCSELYQLQLHWNELTGSIPASLGNCTALMFLTVDNNGLSGEIPNEIYDIQSLQRFNINDNKDITGNPAEGFANHPSLNEMNITGTGVVQAKPDAPLLTDDKFTYNDLASELLNADGTLVASIEQEDIDRAQASADWWQEPTRSEWQTKINQAQELLYQRDAEDAINDLFNPDGTIKDTVTREEIENAQDLVNKITDVDKKQELQDKLDDAQKQLDERDFVVLKGFETFTGTETVNTTIDAPVEKFSKVYVDGKLLPSSNYVVTSGSTVITLNESYLKILENGNYDVEVEFVSGARVSVSLTVDVKTITDPTNPVDPVDPTEPTKPTTPTKPTNPSVDVPVVSKPSVDTTTSSSTNSSNVNTGDETNTMLLIGMLVVSLVGFVVVYKRKETE